MRRDPALRLLPSVFFLLGWMLLNVLMNLDYPVANPATAPLFRFSPELLGMLLAVCALAWRHVPFHPLWYAPLVTIFLFFRLFRLGETIVPAYLERDFNLFIDTGLLPDLVHLLYNSLSHLTFCLAAGLALGCLVLLAWGLSRTFRAFHHYFLLPGHRVLFCSLTVLLVLLTYLPLSSDKKPLPLFSKAICPRVATEIRFIAQIAAVRRQCAEGFRDAAARLADIPAPLDRLKGASVYIFFIESYGQTIFADSRHFQAIAPVVDDFERMLGRQGFAACSSFLASPTYGGSSWLAFCSFETGIPLPTQIHYQSLIHAKVATLASLFARAGYRTVSVMPGTTLPWPEGSFLQYQKIYTASDLGYQGPPYNWSPMPDQFVLDAIFQREVRDRRQPLFVRSVLVSSHASFSCQPPFLEDWSQIGNGAIYSSIVPITFPVTWPDLRNANEAYVAAITYDLRVLKAYLEQFIDDDALIIILGDHQPASQITGNGRPWSVPIHVISRNPALLAPFFQRGYGPGLVPDQPLPHPGMETFLHDFVLDFSSPS